MKNSNDTIGNRTRDLPAYVCGERGRNRQWVSGALIYEGVKLEREGKLVSTSHLHIYTPSHHSRPTFLFGPDSTK